MTGGDSRVMNQGIRDDIRSIKLECIQIAINVLEKRTFDSVYEGSKRHTAPPTVDEVVRYAHKLYRYVEFGDTPL